MAGLIKKVWSLVTATIGECLQAGRTLNSTMITMVSSILNLVCKGCHPWTPSKNSLILKTGIWNQRSCSLTNDIPDNMVIFCTMSICTTKAQLTLSSWHMSAKLCNPMLWRPRLSLTEGTNLLVWVPWCGNWMMSGLLLHGLQLISMVHGRLFTIKAKGCLAMSSYLPSRITRISTACTLSLKRISTSQEIWPSKLWVLKEISYLRRYWPTWLSWIMTVRRCFRLIWTRISVGWIKVLHSYTYHFTRIMIRVWLKTPSTS